MQPIESIISIKRFSETVSWSIIPVEVTQKSSISVEVTQKSQSMSKGKENSNSWIIKIARLQRIIINIQVGTIIVAVLWISINWRWIFGQMSFSSIKTNINGLFGFNWIFLPISIDRMGIISGSLNMVEEWGYNIEKNIVKSKSRHMIFKFEFCMLLAMEWIFNCMFSQDLLCFCCDSIMQD